MTTKNMSLEEAAALVRDGDQVVMSAGMDWAPMAFLRQLVRQGSSGLRLVGIVGGNINFDLPIGAGIVASADSCSVGLEPFSRNAPNFVRHVTRGRIRMLDNT